MMIYARLRSIGTVVELVLRAVGWERGEKVEVKERWFGRREARWEEWGIGI